MPTLTRLAAALLFAAAAIYLGQHYATFFETPPPMASLAPLLGGAAAFAGWSFVGVRIEGRLVRDIFHALQGVILTVMLALFVYGSVKVFQLGYQMRYKTLWDAAVGFFDLTGAHVLRMGDRDFLILAAILTVVIGTFLSVFFRWAEKRRFA